MIPLIVIFVLLRAALAGQTYLTFPEMWRIVLAALGTDDHIKTGHVCRTWDFSQIGAAAELPRIHGNDLPRIHVFNVFRNPGGIGSNASNT